MAVRRALMKTRSKFIKVQCPECGNIQVTFDRASIVVRCEVCENVLAVPTGGKAEIRGKIVEILE